MKPIALLPNTFRAFYGAFQTLYPIQQRAIEPILEGKDVIIQSATGSGKTEAVLAPCLERVITAQSPASILYIVPTRALAVDIFRRFQSVLTDRLGLAVAIRTGDIKKNGGGFPALMLSTPESLDVMLGSSNPDISGFIGRINTVVIDEVHPLIHHYRGRHLVYLLQRLLRRKDRRLQKIALSATLADPDEVRRFLCCDPEAVCLVETVSRPIVPRLVHLLDDDGELIALIDDLYRQWDYQKILIFANSRGRCDKIFESLNRSGTFRQAALLHYSNLSAKQRKEVERRFRKQGRAVCVATSTLELGIDVGDVDAVVLFEPPDSAAAFLQRIGRANRRKGSIHFWGVCRGERSGEQLLRFLALLYLARQGRVEKPLPKLLPSVLSQQIISCLYEKKRLSPAALKDLFASDDVEETSRLIEDIFAGLVKKRWLRETRIRGIYRGGRRYGDAFLERRIWNNFPETEEEYSLIVSGEAVADIPLSIVRQLDVGDKVLLTGRRLRILWIDEGRTKRVLAEPTEEKLDAKEILWVGMGCHVSLETARAMGDVLKSRDPSDNIAAAGLFSRTRKLIEKQIETDKRAVVLANSIEVVLTGGGLYQYRTYLGAVGNMILAQSIKDYFARLSEDIYLLYDEIGLTASAWVHFEKLCLPLEPGALDNWIFDHFKTVRAMFPLNAFCATLPPEILRRELADFILDPRLIKFFRKLAESSSNIVAGDPNNLQLSLAPYEEKKSEFIETAALRRPLLAREKKRRGAHLPDIPGETALYRIRPLTGTIIGDYFRHGQCPRRLCWGFLRPEDQPPQQNHGDDRLFAERIKRGLAFEARILEELQGLQQYFQRIAEKDERGKPRSLESRFAETLDRLGRACRCESGGGKGYLAHGVLMGDAVLSPSPSRFGPSGRETLSIKGIGIPDLLCVVPAEDNFRIEVGDIKSTLRPRYHQKWQIAFYAYLLNTCLQHEMLKVPARTADTGFLLVPSPVDDTPRRHNFDLRPYLATLNAVFKNIEDGLSTPPQTAFWRLQTHCIGCVYFDVCYRQALAAEEIQFIPRLSHGELLKLRALGLKDMTAVAAWFDDLDNETRKEKNSPAPPSGIDELPAALNDGVLSMLDTTFSPSQKERLQAAVNALIQNTISVNGHKTHLFPSNAATCFFVHLQSDPLTMRPAALGLAVKKNNQTPQIFTWIIASGMDLPQRFYDFGCILQDQWQASAAENKAPHIFLFGSVIRQQLHAWAVFMKDEFTAALFRQAETAYWTDLTQVLRDHFALPIPGRMTRAALSDVLGIPLEQPLGEPDSLLHGDRFTGLEIERADSAGIEAYLKTILTFDMQLYQWIISRLKSDWRKETLGPAKAGRETMGDLYLRFIAAEQTCRDRDIQRLQALSLAERSARFRALGPLKFIGATLDEEGRFLYRFAMVDIKNVGLSKFRQGDFLKLVPVGMEDLQSGMPVILKNYDSQEGKISLYSRRKGSTAMNSDISYSLEEDAEDWNTPKLIETVRQVYAEDTRHPVRDVLCGRWNYTHPEDRRAWVGQWLRGEGNKAGLNPFQQTALTLPFQYALSLIQGPPGTGKTSLLGWILIALIRHAEASRTPLRIAVSALTHHAIDNVLTKVVSLVNAHHLGHFPARCWKLGNWDGPEFDENSGAMQVEGVNTSDQIVFPPYLIVGATGYALYNLKQKNAERFAGKPFDWIIFDEASQLLVPQAMLSLVHGKGNYLFLGDIHQLPPVVRSPRSFPEDTLLGTDDSTSDEVVYRSLLETLMQRYPRQNAFLKITYRMNAEICAFPSRTWYDGELQPAPKNADARLTLAHPVSADNPIDKIIAPDTPVVLVRTDHIGCGQQSDAEATILARIAHHLLHHHRLPKEQLAIITPHRAQNNAVCNRLSELLPNSADLPLIDTVERIQGAERDVILFGLTSSDPDQVLGEFLNNPNRFNVAITRARKKLIIVGSKIFISAVARNEHALNANACFKAFFEQITDTLQIKTESTAR